MPVTWRSIEEKAVFSTCRQREAIRDPPGPSLEANRIWLSYSTFKTPPYVGCRNTDVRWIVVVIDSQTGELDPLAIDGWVDYLGYDVKRKRLYASCGAGQVYTYPTQEDGTYREPRLTPL
jgi:hypothetical protein